MNYLESNEYKDAKKQLKDDYSICFHKIETYMQLTNIYGLHQEACLIQILDDFLSAQSDAKPLQNITGPDIKKYCDTMIQAEKKRNKGKLDIIAMLAGIPFTIMFFALLGTLKHYNDKLGDLHNSIIINAYSISFPLLYLIFYYIIKLRIAKALFNHAKISRIITTFMSFILLGFVIMIADASNQIIHIAIPVPFPLFITILILSLSILIVVSIISAKENKHLKFIPESYEFSLEQVTCSECGMEYDIDYPKCPYCKHINELL